MLAVSRGDRSLGIYDAHEIAEWKSAYIDLIALCRAVDFFYCRLSHRRLKLRPLEPIGVVACIGEEERSFLYSTTATLATLACGLCV